MCRADGPARSITEVFLVGVHRQAWQRLASRDVYRFIS
nr:hypothetical protein [Kibdelosporangium sp. MJ126-NF4]